MRKGRYRGLQIISAASKKNGLRGENGSLKIFFTSFGNYKKFYASSNFMFLTTA